MGDGNDGAAVLAQVAGEPQAQADQTAQAAVTAGLQGAIGADAFRRIVSHPALKALPFLLETPNDLSGYATEIHLLREWAE